MKRARFILSTLAASPGILFVYSPLLVLLTLVGVAVPFATGHLIDGLVMDAQSGASPETCAQRHFAPLLVLFALLLAKALLTPILQRIVCTRARTIEADLQFRFPLILALFVPFARRFTVNSYRVRQRSDTTFNTLFFSMDAPRRN